MSDALFRIEFDTALTVLLAAVAAMAFGIGWLIAHAHAQRRVAVLETRLDDERATMRDRLEDMERTFAALSSAALKQNSQTFLDLAHETLQRFHVQAKGELELREHAVEGLVAPLRESLHRTEQQIAKLEQTRREAQGMLSAQLKMMVETQRALHGETRNLVQALRRPEVRGQWGELTLRRLVELSGMVEHCDFLEQPNTSTAEGRLRPDMIVHLPAGRQVVVDVKTPLDAYLSAVDATDEATRTHHLQRHAANVKQRIRELSAKAYWSQFARTLDFVVLFIPGDQFLAAALDVDRTLLEGALARRVILATPTSLVALLRAVAFGWRQESFAANAEQIRATAEELHTRLATLSEHLTRLGRSIDGSVAQFNRLVGSFESKVLPEARRFETLGVAARKALSEPAALETRPREVSVDDP